MTKGLKLALELVDVPISVAAHVWSVVDDEDVPISQKIKIKIKVSNFALHPWGVVQSSQQLRSEEEVLRAADVTGSLHQQLEHQPLVASIHALVDLVHTPAQINYIENISTPRPRTHLNGTDVSCCRANM